MLPLNAINSNIASLPHNLLLLSIIPHALQQIQTALI